MKKITKDNRGLSLIELLVAIVVLGVVCIPLITMFVNSAKINRNAQRVHSSSTLAQSVMERYKATKLEKLIADVFGASTVSMASTTMGIGGLTVEQQQTVSENQEAFTKYVFYEPNLVADNGKIYDAKITMNPIPYSSFTSVSDASDINLVAIPDLPMIDTATSPVISNQISAQDRKVTGDDPIAKKIYSLMGQYAPTSLSAIGISDWSSLSNKLEKEIEITIEMNSLGNPGMADVRCDLKYTYPTPEGDKVYTVNAYQGRYSMKKESWSDKDDEADQTIEGRMDVYLFWTPSAYNGGSDTVRIINKTECRLDVYLIKQDVTGGSAAKFYISDGTFEEQFSSSTHNDGRMCAKNINLITNLTVTAQLYDLDSEVRCYEVVVELYEPGETYTDLVTTLTSTKEIYQ